MEVIKNMSECPMQEVDDVVFELRRLANMLFLLSGLNDRTAELDAEEFCDTMFIIWGCLDRQIKALDGIQWPQQKAVGA